MSLSRIVVLFASSWVRNGYSPGQEPNTQILVQNLSDRRCNGLRVSLSYNGSFRQQNKSPIEVLGSRRANGQMNFLLDYSLGHGRHRDL